MRPLHAPHWGFLVVVLLIVAVWPPRDDISLAVKFVNWVVDPTDALPVLPDQLPLGQGDNPEAVAMHDLLTQQYDALYLKGGWTRTRLQLKVARDPINPATERQMLLAVGAVAAFLAWRMARR